MENIFPDVKVVQKAWGSERWLFNTDRLCVKQLIVMAGKCCSMHFHKNKQEVFYIRRGKVEIQMIDTTTSQISTYTLCPGDSIIINPLVPHRISAILDSLIIESSTHHEDSDSYRVAPGDSQK